MSKFVQMFLIKFQPCCGISHRNVYQLIKRSRSYSNQIIVISYIYIIQEQNFKTLFSHLSQESDQAKKIAIKIASDVLESVKKLGLQRFVESSGRKGFKIPVFAFSMFPEPVATSLKSLSKTSSTFNGKVGIKVYFLKLFTNQHFCFLSICVQLDCRNLD